MVKTAYGETALRQPIRKAEQYSNVAHLRASSEPKPMETEARPSLDARKSFIFPMETIDAGIA
jgi:hypothetical protein